MLEPILFVLYGVLLFVFVIGVWRLRFAFKYFRMKTTATTPRDVLKLPSVTVAIPARNETHAMTESLERVIASNYEKLEIIVLDDESGDDTSALIKAFASQGVRFVSGSPLPNGWLGKNHALQELLKEASGTYILFMDVDTHIAPDSIGQLVTYLIEQDAKMVSVLPRREDGPRVSVLFSTLRYFWEVMFHRKDAPATSSSAWMIHKETLLKKWNGFESFKAAIQPESKYSAALKADGQYRFVMSTPALGVNFEKKWSSQLETSVRLLFPLLGSKIAHGIIAVLDLSIFLLPLVVVLSGFVFGFGIHQIISGVWILAFAGLYGAYLMRMWNKGWVIGALIWPYIVLQEIYLIIKSMVSYSRDNVTWKGRPIKLAEQISTTESIKD